MATLTELRTLFDNTDLKNKVQVAVIIAAEAIRTEDAGTANHAARLVWAKSAFENPKGVSDAMLMALLAQNSDLTVAQITGATDAAIKTAAANAVNVFAGS